MSHTRLSRPTNLVTHTLRTPCRSSPYAAMLAAQDVAVRCREIGITALHIKIRATGGTGSLPLLHHIQTDHLINDVIITRRNQDSWTWCSIRSPSFGPSWNENRSNWGRYSRSLRFYPKKGWTTRTTIVRKRRNYLSFSFPCSHTLSTPPILLSHFLTTPPNMNNIYNIQ